MRVETMAPNQKTASGLTTLVEPDRGSRALHSLLAEKAASRERAKLPDRLLQETEQTPAADSTTSSSGYSGARAEEMASTFGGLEADGISFEKSGFAAGGFVDRSDVLELSIVEKSTANVLVERDKAQRGVMGVMSGRD